MITLTERLLWLSLFYPFIYVCNEVKAFAQHSPPSFNPGIIQERYAVNTSSSFPANVNSGGLSRT